MKFHYCSYWGTWSRRLSETHPGGPIVEVDLTPINPQHSSSWEETKQVRVRVHCTANDRADKDFDHLPENIRERMIEHLGETVTHRLLTEDFYSQIDWKKYSKICNGGAFLKNIKY